MREDILSSAKEALEKAGVPKDEPYIPNTIDKERLDRIMEEFVAGFDVIKKYCLAASVFGSSRCSFEDEVYQNAKGLAKVLAEDGFSIITGGGHGVMQAASEGAQEAGGDAVGLNIELPYEQQLNDHVTDSQEFHYFFIRKVMLSFASEVYIFFPGGFGTLDEFFEIVTLIQTHKIQKIPVVLVGKEYWGPLLSWIDEVLNKENHAIDASDMEIYHLVDSVEEARAYINKMVPIDKLKAC